MKCPCTKDCLFRSARCHAECKEYLAYEKEKHREYAENRMVSIAKADAYAYRYESFVKAVHYNKKRK